MTSGLPPLPSGRFGADDGPAGSDALERRGLAARYDDPRDALAELLRGHAASQWDLVRGLNLVAQAASEPASAPKPAAESRSERAQTSRHAATTSRRPRSSDARQRSYNWLEDLQRELDALHGRGVQPPLMPVEIVDDLPPQVPEDWPSPDWPTADRAR